MVDYVNKYFHFVAVTYMYKQSNLIMYTKLIYVLPDYVEQ